MESVKVKAHAKLNFTLHITGREGGYHLIDSIVASVDLFDAITVRKRRDKLINITMHGEASEYIDYGENNAVKAAEEFVRKFSTDGADIVIYKNIPIGAGLGGSSADAAGVLNALAKLYKVDDITSLKQIADNVGSDTKYMLGGGWARLFGRGEIVKKIESNLKLHILLLVPQAHVSTAQCYNKFDEFKVDEGNSDDAEMAAVQGDLTAFAANVQNSLTVAAESICPQVEKCLNELIAFDPIAVNMSGSGCAVYAIFDSREMCEYVKSRYRGRARTFILEVK